MNFRTDAKYSDRETKARYVWLKYQTILQGHILDVGSDECYLRHHLPEGVEYWGIGLGGNPDQQVDLEKELIPFPDASFDCVLCLDVLEHVENIHKIFDELCRVTRRYVIVSLPNPWADFYSMLRYGDYLPGQAMKFYGLPLERPDDRHKWLFSNEEAECFIRYRAEKNNMHILQMDTEGVAEETQWRVKLHALYLKLLFRRDLKIRNLYARALWAVLEKE